MQGALRAPPFFTPRNALILVAGYYLLHVVLRTAVSDSLHLDEAEQLIVTQEWQWGYGSQPPLYNWLQKLFFMALGPSVFALALLKNLLLFGIAGFTLLSAREVFENGEDASASMLALWLVPGLAWESQRDQTHLVLATFLSAMTFYLGMRLARTRENWLYPACGVVAGLGVLSKYNFALVPVSLILAASTLPAVRGALRVRGGLLFLGGFAAVTTAHFWWMFQHWDLVMTQSQSFGQSAASPAGTALRGSGQVLLRIVEYCAVPVLIFAGFRLTGRSGEVRSIANPVGLKLLQRSVLLGLLLILVTTVLFQVTRIKARWLQPLLIVLPILLVAGARPYLTGAGRVRLALLVCLVMLVVPMVLYGRVAAAGRLGKTTGLNVPHAEWAAQLRAAGFTRGNILAGNKALAGNLKLQFPDSRVITPEFTRVALLPDSPALVAWRPAEKAFARAEALQFAAKMFPGRFDSLPVQRVNAPARHAPAEVQSLGYVEARGPVQPQRGPAAAPGPP